MVMFLIHAKNGISDMMYFLKDSATQVMRGEGYMEYINIINSYSTTTFYPQNYPQTHPPPYRVRGRGCFSVLCFVSHIRNRLSEKVYRSDD